MSTRRLPVYIVLDCSGSMSGEPIEAVRNGMRTLVAELKGDPQALETVYLSVITFDSSARQVVPLTEIGLFQEPMLDANGGTDLGGALTILSGCIDTEVHKSSATDKGDWKPLVFLMTDGFPGPGWEGPADAIKAKRFGTIIACAAGPGADTTCLKRITEVVITLTDLQPDSMKQFFKWVSSSVRTTSSGITKDPLAPVNLPPPPGVIQIIP